MIGCRTVGALACALIAACAHSAPDDIGSHEADFPRVRSISYSYIGGEKRHKNNVPSAGRDPVSGSIIVDQIGVLSLRPVLSDPAKPAVVLTPGFGLAGHIFLTTADGRPGWAQAFLAAGHPVHIVDRSHTARTGFDVFDFNAVRQGLEPPESQPSLVLWLDERIWARWGLGPAFGERFEDGKFPLDAIDQLLGAFAPVVSAKRPLPDQAIGNVAGLIELLEREGRGILVTHSASGLDGFNVARQRPDLLSALVAIEPVGCSNEHAEALKGIPTLSVFGDHLDVRPQMIPRFEECKALAAAMTEKGHRGELLSLPDLGVKGNSHIMMSDSNSDAIAQRIIGWINDDE